MNKIYIAAPLAEAQLCCAVAESLAFRGHTVASRWHKEIYEMQCVTGQMPVDPATSEASLRRRILINNMIDIEACDIVLAITDRGDPRATYSEIGYAIAYDRSVVWLQRLNGSGGNIFDASPNVTVVTLLSTAIDEVCR